MNDTVWRIKFMKKEALHIIEPIVFLAILFNAGVCPAQEHSSVGASDDCTKILLNYSAAPNLTRQERTALMDKALLDSLNKYERCQNAHASHSSASGGGGGSGNGGGSGSNGEDAGQGRQNSSTASSGMSGTNMPSDHPSLTNNHLAGADEAPVNKDAHGRTKAMHALSNGKIPEDIPPSDNDSILEEQIRQAAMNETDPVIRKKLWNEYRKYKGLPVAKKPRE